jgi:hypothetical protein
MPGGEAEASPPNLFFFIQQEFILFNLGVNTMIDFRLYVAGRVATKVVIAAGYFAMCHVAKPMRDIESEIARLKKEWNEGKTRQGINDRLAQGKIKRGEWLEEMHNGPARIMWVNLSTSYPDHHRYIANRIRKEYPHATRWI